MRKSLRITPEYVVYLCLWVMLMIMPIAIFYLRAKADTLMEFRWEEVFHIWSWFILFLICFFVHNFFLAPLLLQKRWTAYFSFTVALLISFIVISGLKNDPGPMGHHGPPYWIKKEKRKKEIKNFDEKFNERFKRHKRPLADHLFGPEVPVNILILIGLLGLNLGVKLYFKSEQDRANLQQLEKEKMYLQLQYLKFQINPHFFMNTLNNIQVLIDMDAEAAKASLRELSVMMRFVLYEADKDWVSLNKDVVFLRNYIKLMQLRYTDSLTITVDIPECLPDISIPPLIFPTFVENAFKHGVSYSQNSFITVMVDVDEGKLIFCCLNSKQKEAEQRITKQDSGVGLTNVKRRLDLIYGEQYTLEIKDEENTYKVQLSLPLSTSPIINNTTRE